MFPERPLPKIPWIKAVGVVAAFSAFAGVTVWVSVRLQADWMIGLPFFAALPVGYYFFWVSRCPECGHRLTSHREMLGGSTAYRLLSRCDRCKIDWDTGQIGDTSYDD